MRKAWVLVFLLFGCGGGGSQTESIFAGTYSGTFRDASGTVIGPASGTVAQYGTVDWQGTNSGSGAVILIRGGVKNSGQFSGSAIAGGETASTVGTFTLSGNTLTATMTIRDVHGDIYSVFVMSK